MSKIIIVDGNNEIELSTAPKENIKAYMVKGEPGTDGTSPSAVVTKVDDTTTLTVTDANGTTQSNIMDGYNPTITAEKENKVTTLTITDINGTATTEIYDGLDITGGVPTDGIIGFDGLVGDIPDGYEIVSDSIATQTDLNAKQDTLISGTNIKTINSTSLLGSGDIAISGATINDSYSTSTTEAYSCNYVNSIIESGSNANGTYIKFSDGTLICYSTVKITTAINTAWGSMYESPQMSLGTTPYTFYGSFIVNGTCVGTRSAFLENITDASGNSYGKTYLARPSSATSNDYNFQLIAIGRWKA